MADFVRESTRIPTALKLRVRLDAWSQFEILYARNISRGGMFLAMAEPATPGTELQLEIGLPEGQAVVLRGQVAHTVSAESAGETGAPLRWSPIRDCRLATWT